VLHAVRGALASGREFLASGGRLGAVTGADLERRGGTSLTVIPQEQGHLQRSAAHLDPGFGGGLSVVGGNLLAVHGGLGATHTSSIDLVIAEVHFPRHRLLLLQGGGSLGCEEVFERSLSGLHDTSQQGKHRQTQHLYCLPVISL